MSKYFYGKTNKTHTYICVVNCCLQYNDQCTSYIFKEGEEYEYTYTKSKFVSPIYDMNGLYHGSANNIFIDTHFISKENSDIIAEVDRWFGELLESPIRLKRIKSKK